MLNNIKIHYKLLCNTATFKVTTLTKTYNVQDFPFILVDITARIDVLIFILNLQEQLYQFPYFMWS